MASMSLKRTWLVTLIAVLVVAVSVQDAEAFGRTRGGWGSYGGSWGSHGSWGSYGGSRGSYGSYGSWGSHGSYGSYGSHGGYGASYSGHNWYGEPYYGRSGGRVYGVVASSEASNSSGEAAATAAPKTRLTLHVPADAKVTLAGGVTKQRGEIRTYSTTKLPADETWENYEVVAEIERDGRVFRQQRIITLTGGQSQELSIDFPSQQLAQSSR
jgi:uncharacterized protein (TIGR03000 family)